MLTVAQERLHAVEERLAGGRDLDLAAGAAEEIEPEGLFQLGDLPAEGGLGDAERLGGGAEM